MSNKRDEVRVLTYFEEEEGRAEEEKKRHNNNKGSEAIAVDHYYSSTESKGDEGEKGREKGKETLGPVLRRVSGEPPKKSVCVCLSKNNRARA